MEALGGGVRGGRGCWVAVFSDGSFHLCFFLKWTSSTLNLGSSHAAVTTAFLLFCPAVSFPRMTTRPAALEITVWVRRCWRSLSVSGWTRGWTCTTWSCRCRPGECGRLCRLVPKRRCVFVAHAASRLWTGRTKCWSVRRRSKAQRGI